MRQIKLLALITLVAVSCVQKTENSSNEPKEYAEQYRPQYHFSPPNAWMNDPNGLVYNEGIYHLFYQYCPYATVWGPMHWGHAVSEDLIHWKNKPIALYPDEYGLIFSGSAVVDKNNTSGFGKEGEVPLVAIYTYHLMEGEKEGRNDFQTQGVAYSLDNGETWTKYADNPVIKNQGIRDFRDPKVFWHEETESWIMVLVAGDHAKVYRSKNLKEWDNISDFGQDKGSHGGVWECPDLFPLKVEGTDEVKWVLIISIGNGAANGGSGTQYFIGDFDGTTFTSDQEDIKWLDWGTDNYAGVTYNDTPDDERKFIGWMSNWQYALKTPTSTWRSAMTLPRKLSLKRVKDNLILVNYPINTISAIEKNKPEMESFKLESHDRKVFINQELNQGKVSLEIPRQDFSIAFLNDLGEECRLIYDSVSNLIMVDRTKSGETGFHYEFGNKLHYMPLNDKSDKNLQLEIFMDQSSCEIFVNKGENAMTEQLFPFESYNKIEIRNLSNGTMHVKDFSIQGIESIWD